MDPIVGSHFLSGFVIWIGGEHSEQACQLPLALFLKPNYLEHDNIVPSLHIHHLYVS